MSVMAHATAAQSGAGEATAKRGGWTPYWLLLPGLLWLVVFFIVPTVQLFTVSLQSQFPDYPGYYYRDVNVGNYATAFSQFLGHFGRSLFFAGLATIFGFLLGYPLAYAMAFKAGKWRNVMMICVIAPFFTSFILRTIAWRQILADEGPVVSTLKTLHLMPQNGRITETAIAVVAGLTYNFLPFMVLPIYASFEKMDASLVEAAVDLGCRPTKAFWWITVPIALPGILAGAMLVFIPAVGEFVIPDLLGGSETLMIGRTLWVEFFNNRDWPLASTVAIVLLLVLVLPIMWFQRSQAKGGGGA